MLPSKNNNSTNIHEKSGFTLGQVLYGQPQINTLNDIIGKHNTSILKENIFSSNKDNFNNLNNQLNNSNQNQSENHIDKNKINHINNLNISNLKNSSNPINHHQDIQNDNPTNTDNEDMSESGDYSTELINSSDTKNKVKLTNKLTKTQKIDNSTNSANSANFHNSSSFSSYSDDSNSRESDSEEILSESKLYWEYGNTGLKIKEFKKKMSKNLAIMYYVDRLFNEYIDTVLSNNYSKLFSSNSNAKFNLKTGKIKSNNGKVTVTLNHDKLIGNFNVLEAGFITISNIKITDKELKKNYIPNLDSFLSHKDNIYHISKITKLLNLQNKMSVKTNLSNKNINLQTISSNANSYIDDLVKKDKKKYILRSDSNTGFYTKIYSDHSKGFIIDGKNNLINYVATNINFKEQSINLRYYAFNIENGKIISL
jgi:hypothetical protein